MHLWRAYTLRASDILLIQSLPQEQSTACPEVQEMIEHPQNIHWPNTCGLTSHLHMVMCAQVHYGTTWYQGFGNRCCRAHLWPHQSGLQHVVRSWNRLETFNQGWEQNCFSALRKVSLKPNCSCSSFHNLIDNIFNIFEFFEKEYYTYCNWHFMVTLNDKVTLIKSRHGPDGQQFLSWPWILRTQN